jgi:ABC-2 type transport system permease protein
MNESLEMSPVHARRSPLVGGTELATMVSLIRREFWEHRILWMAPLAVAVLLLVGAAFGRAQIGHAALPGGTMVLTPQMVRALFAATMLGLGAAQYFTMSVVLWYYAADCLYAERRDRSILFWKSMPVSDGQTVLSKVAVAMLVVPLGIYLVTAVTVVLTSGIWSLRGLGGAPVPFFWDTHTWLQLEAMTFFIVVLASLWYAPVTAYLMLVSALARRSVQLWVFLLPIVAVIVERFAFGTHYLWTIILYRLSGGWQAGIFRYVGRLFSGHDLGPDAAAITPSPFQSMDLGQAFSNIDLWIGLVVALVLFFVAARVRRYRDETT